MPIEQPGASEVIAFVTRYMVCAACSQTYGPDDIRVALHKDGQWSLIACCPACQVERLVTAYDRPPYADLKRVGSVQPSKITQEAVDEWTTFLESFTGDAFDLLASD
jgi:hypothetical protein